MKKFCIGIAALGALGVAPAFAADMAVKAPPAPPPPAWSWTGFYVGANAGYGWGVNNSPVSYTNNLGVTVTSSGPDAKGGFGGGQIGYNWQTGAAVLGIEADIQGAGLRNTVSGITSDGLTLFSGTQKLNWFGTVRGRLGYAFNRTLVYVTGGYAGGHVSDTVLLTGVGVSDLLTGSPRHNGSTIGGGLEYLIAKNWSAKAEYQYIDLGHESLFGVSTGGTPVTTSSIRNRFNTVRVGLNYHFN
jgi:outer membrane immunogenic protein